MVIPGLGHPYIKLWEVILSYAGPSHYELPQDYSFLLFSEAFIALLEIHGKAEQNSKPYCCP